MPVYAGRSDEKVFAAYMFYALRMLNSKARAITADQSSDDTVDRAVEMWRTSVRWISTLYSFYEYSKRFTVRLLQILPLRVLFDEIGDLPEDRMAEVDVWHTLLRRFATARDDQLINLFIFYDRMTEPASADPKLFMAALDACRSVREDLEIVLGHTSNTLRKNPRVMRKAVAKFPIAYAFTLGEAANDEGLLQLAVNMETPKAEIAQLYRHASRRLRGKVDTAIAIIHLHNGFPTFAMWGILEDPAIRNYEVLALLVKTMHSVSFVKVVATLTAVADQQSVNNLTAKMQDPSYMAAWVRHVPMLVQMVPPNAEPRAAWFEVVATAVQTDPGVMNYAPDWYKQQTGGLPSGGEPSATMS